MLMGTQFGIQVVAADESRAREAIDAAFAEVARVEEALSEWRETSEISAVNRAAGGDPVAVGPELLDVLQRSVRASELTEGAFDVTFASCGHLWSFADPRIPNRSELDACLPRVDFRRIEIDPERSSVFLPHSEMRIGIAGIGKGYGVDRAAEVLESHGITDYIVDGGGDVRLRGRNLERPWSVGIAHPRQRGELLGTVELDRGSVVSSGDYMSFFERDGVRYHHILDPATGMPAREAIAVTVIAPEATEADALATGLFVMGPERGLRLVESLPGVEALLLTDDLTVHASRGFPDFR
jgi:thiamine biosynthesis lipoprotein